MLGILFGLFFSSNTVQNKRNSSLEYFSYDSITGSSYNSVYIQQNKSYDNEFKNEFIDSELLYDNYDNLIEDRIRIGDTITYNFYENGSKGVFQKQSDSMNEISWIFTLTDSEGNTTKEILWNSSLVFETEFENSLNIPIDSDSIISEKEYLNNQLSLNIDYLSKIKTEYTYEDNKVIENGYDINFSSGSKLKTYKEYVNNELTVSYEYEEQGRKVDLINNIRIVPWTQKLYNMEKSARIDSYYTLDNVALKHDYYVRGITQDDILLHLDADYVLTSIEGDENALWDNTKDRIVMRCNELLREKGYSDLTRTSEMDSYAEKGATIHINNNGNSSEIYTGYTGKGKHVWWLMKNSVMGIGNLEFSNQLDYSVSFKKIGISIKPWNGQWLVYVALYD